MDDSPDKEPNVLSYNNYRNFLKDLYTYLKFKKGKYSYRQFAQDLGFKHSNYIHLVVQQKRNLSVEALHKIIHHLKWSSKQKLYFQKLVGYNQGKNPQESIKLNEDIEKILGKRRSILQTDAEAYFTHWYLPVLREIVSFKNFVSNLNWMARKLCPKVEEAEVNKAIKILERLGMIRKIKGKWVQADHHLSTPPEVTSSVYHQYHKALIRLSEQSLQLPATSRDVSSMTMALSDEAFLWLKERLADFRDEIQNDLQGFKEDATNVYLLNMQFFPATNK